MRLATIPFLKNRDVFMDMLTDSGVNAMSDKQQAAVLRPMTVMQVRIHLPNLKVKSKKSSVRNISFLPIKGELVKISFHKHM